MTSGNSPVNLMQGSGWKGPSKNIEGGEGGGVLFVSMSSRGHTFVNKDILTR